MSAAPIPCRYYAGQRYHIDNYLREPALRVGPVRIITRTEQLVGTCPDGPLQVVGPTTETVDEVIRAAREHGWEIQFVDY